MKQKFINRYLIFSGSTKKLTLFALCMAMLFGATGVDASGTLQPKPVTGVVKDALNGESLPGVNIIVKGTNRGTVSDLDGNFTINAEIGETLLFSFIGYLSEEYEINNETNIEVTLTQDITSLDEIIVIGYGVQKKKLVTGATSQVKGEELEKINSTNALQALQGKASGVNISSVSGQPGEGYRVTIRGVGTIGNAGPLYIVDGVQTGDITYLNPSDIESVDVLKDAASAAIYGSRAANGVILVTTKRGKSGVSQITFDAFYGIQNRAKEIGLLNAREYATIMNEQHLNSGGLTSDLPFDVNNLPAYTSEGSADNNWLDEMFVQNAVTQNYVLGATKGTETSNFAISLSYAGQEGIVGGAEKSNYDRYNGLLNSENKLYNDRIKIGQHLTFSTINKNGVQVGNQYGNSLRSAYNTSPLLPMYDEEGEFFSSDNETLLDQNGEPYWNNTEANPYASMVINNQNITTYTKLLGDIYAEFEIIKNLKFKTSFGLDYSAKEYRSFTPIYRLSIYSYNDVTTAQQDLDKNLAINTDNLLTYDLNLGPHSFNFMSGVSTRSYKGSYLSVKNSDLIFTDLEHAYINNATNQEWPRASISGGPNDEDKLLSYFGRIQYNFNETYLFNYIYRLDGSSKFATTHRWGDFHSLSGGWVMSNEEFMLATSSVINFFKIRASWGQNGNQAIDAYNYLATITDENTQYAFGNEEGKSETGTFPDILRNEKAIWETNQMINIGFDSRILSSNFGVTFDWYRRSTNDWLVKAPITATAGTGAPFINGGNVINSGVELGLSYNGNMGSFSYSIDANGSYNKNEVTEIPTDDGIIHGADNMLYPNSLEFYRVESGYPIGYFWGFKTDGLFQTNNEVTEHLSSDNIIIQPNAKPGDVRYIDQNDDGKIDADDKVMIGDPNPDFIFGLNVSLNYKGIDLFVMTNGVAGNQLVQSYRGQGKFDNYTTEILDRWHGEGTSYRIPRVTNANINYQFSDLFVKDGSFLRISNVSLGYDLANKLQFKYLGQFRIYGSVQNLKTFTKYTGMDPEVGYGFDNGVTDKFSRGIDLGFYPRPKTFLIGIGIKF